MITDRYTYQPMTRDTQNGRRVYLTPEGEKLASVTSILDATKPEEKRQALQQWKNRVGEEQAQKITTEAANRGTRMHSYLEHYIKTGDMKDFPSNPYAQPSWFMASEVILTGLVSVDEFWGVEVPVYYSGLYAGTTDCVGIWKGQPAIMDFKQTNRPKKREWIEDYFLQLTAYSAAHNEMHGTKINSGVILMCAQPTIDTESPTYQEFEITGSEFDYWLEQWQKRVELYYSLN